MRDNHDGMPELLSAYERDGQFFATVAVTLGSECRHLEFGLQPDAFRAIRHVLQARPFDQLPGLHYRYFIIHSARRVPDTDRVEVSFRIEQGSSAQQFPFEVPQSLAANLFWFAGLTDFASASHLRTVNPNGRNA